MPAGCARCATGINMFQAAVRIRRQLDREVEEAGEAAPTMDVDAIEAMALVERSHWWFLAKRELVLAELDRRSACRARSSTWAPAPVGSSTPCGAPGGPRSASSWTTSPSGSPPASTPRPAMAQAVAEAVPFADGAAAAVTSLDVLEHLDDDVAGFRELARVAGAGGLVVVAVPAYKWAWSEHDVRLGHRRRYNRVALRAAAHAAGHRRGPLHALPRLARARGLRAPAHAAAPAAAGPAGRGGELRVTRRQPAAHRSWAPSSGSCCRRFDLPLGLSILLVGRVSDAGEHAAARGRGTPTR